MNRVKLTDDERRKVVSALNNAEVSLVFAQKHLTGSHAANGPLSRARVAIREAKYEAEKEVLR